MLAAAHVEVDGAPVLVLVLVGEGLVVVGIHVAQIVSTAAGKARHGVQLEWEHALIVDVGNIDHSVGLGVPGPVLGVTERRLAGLGGLIVADFGQLQGQALLGNHVGHVVLVVDGERFAPIALAGEDGIAQTVVHLHASDAGLGDVLLRGGNGLLHGEPVEAELGTRWRTVGNCGRAVANDAFLGIVALLADIGSLDEGDDGQTEVLGKGIVARVVGRHSHDGTGAIAGQHVF